MALEKQIVVDRIEVLESGIVQVRTATRILEDGVLLSVSYHRHTVPPGTDLSKEVPRVAAVCEAVHTKDVIKDYRSSRED